MYTKAAAPDENVRQLCCGIRMECEILKRKGKKRNKTALWGYLFLSPYVILFLIFSLFPIVFSFALSFTTWNGIGEMEFVGLKNYGILLFGKSNFWKAVGNTVIIMLEYIPITLAGGLGLAVLLNSRYIKRKGFFRFAYFLPYMVTPVAVGLMFALFFDWKTGIVNKILTDFGVIREEIYWLGEPMTARIVVAFSLVWKLLGYVCVIYSAGISNIPEHYYEAASLDGATGLQKFRHITLPLLRPITVFLSVTIIISGFQLVEEPMQLFTGWAAGTDYVGGPGKSCLTAMWYMYDTAFGTQNRYGMASAIAYSLFALIAVFTFLGTRGMSGKEEKR